MECKCIEQYKEIKPGMKFDVVEIYKDYYVLDNNKGCKFEVSNKYFDKCFININLD